MKGKFYKKIYKRNLNGVVYLSNTQKAYEYIDESIEKLFNSKNREEELKIKLNIFKDLKNIYEYDILCIDDKLPFINFDPEEDNKEFIKKKLWNQTFGIYLCNIFREYHKRVLKERKRIKMVIIPKGFVDYEELYYEAIKNYCSTILNVENIEIKSTGEVLFNNELKSDLAEKKHAISASYILPSLIEHFLGVSLQCRLLYNKLNQVNILEGNKKIILSSEEKNIIEAFKKHNKKSITFFLAPEKYIMELMYSLFRKAKIIPKNSDYRKILTRNKLTLGAIIHSEYAKSQIKDEYMFLIEKIFSYMKIRNIIMHGMDSGLDCFDVGIVSVMLDILWAIGDENIFNKRKIIYL